MITGLSPEQNRNVPPLKYDFVYNLIRDFPNLRFTINGGIKTFDDVEDHFRQHVDGVMVGRGILEKPWYWAGADSMVYGEDNPASSRRELLDLYTEYAAKQEERARSCYGPTSRILKSRRNRLAKPLYNLFACEPRGKLFRRTLQESLCDLETSFPSLMSASLSVLSPSVLDASPPSSLAQSVFRGDDVQKALQASD